MNKLQRTLLAVYLLLTLLIIMLDRSFPDSLAIRIFKFGTVCSLLVSARLIPKDYWEQRILTLALWFAVGGDFFLGFGPSIQLLGSLPVPLGMLSYALAYLLLSQVFARHALGKNSLTPTPVPAFRPSYPKFELLTALGIMAVFIPVFLSLAPFFHGIMFSGALLFGLVLCCMAWKALSTLVKGYFNPRASRLIATAGVLIFASDLAVAFSLFHPEFSGSFIPWLENAIWGTFIPAWTLILLLIAEPDLLNSENP